MFSYVDLCIDMCAKVSIFLLTSNSNMHMSVFIHLHWCVCLPVCTIHHFPLSLSLCLCLSVCLSVCLSLSLSLCVSFCVSLSFFIFLRKYTHVCIFHGMFHSLPVSVQYIGNVEVKESMKSLDFDTRTQVARSECALVVTFPASAPNPVSHDAKASLA